MNENEIQNDYQSDEATAHYVALHKMNNDDLARGDLVCVDYLIELDQEIGLQRPAPTVLLSEALDALPAIHSSPVVVQQIVELYHASGLEVPTGLLDLPLQWAKAFCELMQETHWPAYQNCTIHDVFGWNHVIRYGAYLHIQFESRLPHESSHWCEVGEFIAELHDRFEPGICTPPGRLIEFF